MIADDLENAVQLQLLILSFREKLGIGEIIFRLFDIFSILFFEFGSPI